MRCEAIFLAREAFTVRCWDGETERVHRGPLRRLRGLQVGPLQGYRTSEKEESTLDGKLMLKQPYFNSHMTCVRL